jgi:hypothetical protein
MPSSTETYALRVCLLVSVVLALTLVKQQDHESDNEYVYC